MRTLQIKNLAAFATFVAVLAITAVGQEEPAADSSEGKTSPAATKTLPEAGIAHDGVIAAVEHQLLIDPGVDATRIDVQIAEGVVTLKGTVPDILSKDRSTITAETVRGVRAVVNLIDVNCPVRPNAAVERDVEDAFLRDPVADSYEILAHAEDGIVTLTGTVQPQTEKDFAARVARGVKGVRGIKNQIAVETEGERLDQEILAEVRGRLQWDSHVDHRAIKLTVKDGVVTAQGEVPSAAERRRACLDCYVTGVKQVVSDRLVVNPDLVDATPSDEDVDLSDAAICEAVKTAMFYDPRVNSGKVDVLNSAGMVTLSGTADNLRAKRSAADDARSVKGVYFVRNFIKVRSPQQRVDEKIKDSVMAALTIDPLVESYEVDVSVKNGVVSLEGSVDTFFEKAQAEALVAATNDVVAIKNKITIDYDVAHLGYSPYVDDWYFYDLEWYQPGAKVVPNSDWQIERSIKEELFWSPYVDETDIEVDAFGGTVTLTGTVDDWPEFRAAQENAYEGGAVLVINELKVAGL